MLLHMIVKLACKSVLPQSFVRCLQCFLPLLSGPILTRTTSLSNIKEMYQGRLSGTQPYSDLFVYSIPCITVLQGLQKLKMSFLLTVRTCSLAEVKQRNLTHPCHVFKINHVLREHQVMIKYEPGTLSGTTLTTAGPS